MDIRVLGPLEVERDGRLVKLGGRKQRAVLAVLILQARKVISAERLADAVWDGEPPVSAGTTLRGYVSNLRKALEPERVAGEGPTILRTTQAGYLLEVADEQIDARRFERLVAVGRNLRAAGDPEGSIREWIRALELWRGEALQDFAYSEFAQTEAERLAELKLACTEDLFEASLELGRHHAIAGDLDAFCTSHPGRERTLRLRMLALYRCGRQSDALAAYEQGRRWLADELGVQPSPELRALHEQLVRQDAALDAAVDAGPPSGKRTLTFLLGDVESSTEKLRALGDEYSGVLDEHRRLLKETFASHGGHAVHTYGGDQIFAAFDTATNAVSAAVAAQLALRRAGFGRNQALPVRMGVHTGQATYAHHEYFGLAVHLAARVMSAAQGGQVLVSQPTKALHNVREGTEIEFLDVGLHVLKDMPDAIRLFQVLHPELPKDFPPSSTRAGRTDNLPNRLTSFVGRDADIDQIQADLAEGRILTLTGVGGVGKTRLAVEAGRRLVPHYADGVWLCELAPIGDADALVNSLATTLGVERQRGLSMRENLLTALRQRDSLLVLDNCEHLLGPAADLVAEIARDAQGVDVLATSREGLGVDGERTRPVRSLAVSTGGGHADAVRLFEDRARAVRPDFTVDDRTAADVAEICARLDGIPLAIELAAARVTSLSVAQIAKRLAEGFHFLRSGRRTAVDRHKTLEATIDWSYAMLSDAERLLFDRLSVFAGGFTLEAAEAVCGPGLDLDLADGLTSLVAKSMVDADVTGEQARYSLLETMRQYGRDRLAEREDDHDVLRAHTTYFVRFVEEQTNPAFADSERARRRVAAELDNIRAAQASARASSDVDLAVRIVAADPAFHLVPQLPEAFVWAEDAIGMPRAADHPSFPRVLAVAGMGAERRGDLARARQLLTRALELVDDPDDARRLGALYWLTAVSRYEGKLDEARRWSAEHLRVADANDDLVHQASGHWVVSLIESTDGDHAAAVGLAESGYALARNGSSAMRGWALYFLGDALNQAGGDPERALDCLDRSVALCRANEMQFWVGVALVSLASLRARHGDSREALSMFADVVDRWRRLGDWARQWVTLLNLVELFGRIAADEAATSLLGAAEASAKADPNLGPQGERLAKLRLQLRERMGAEAFARATERGRAMSDEAAVAYARAEINRALANAVELNA